MCPELRSCLYSKLPLVLGQIKHLLVLDDSLVRVKVCVILSSSLKAIVPFYRPLDDLTDQMEQSSWLHFTRIVEIDILDALYIVLDNVNSHEIASPSGINVMRLQKPVVCKIASS